MKKRGLFIRASKMPKDAVLLIPEPENEDAPYGIKPGYYNSRQLLRLLDKQKKNADAIQFIADMLETAMPRTTDLPRFCEQAGPNRRQSRE